MNQKPKLLLIDDDSEILEAFSDVLRNDFNVITCDNVEKAIEKLNSDIFRVAVIDIAFPNDKLGGLKVINFINEKRIDVKSIVFTAYIEDLFNEKPFNCGIIDYIEKGIPATPEILLHSAQNALLLPILPKILDVDRPDNIEWKSDNSIFFQYKYKILPVAVVYDLIIKLFPNKRMNDYWKNGIIIKLDKTEAKIEANYEYKTIDIEVVGERRRRTTLFYIRTILNNINQSMKLITECYVLVGKEKILFSYEELLNLEQAEKSTQNNPQLKDVDIKEVLDGIRAKNEINKLFIKELKDKIKQDNLEEVFNVLLDHNQIQESIYNNYTLAIYNSYNSLRREKMSGTISFQDFRSEKAYVVDRILALIDDIDKTLLNNKN